MKKEDLLKELEKLARLSDGGDKEAAHEFADQALLEYIDDKEVTEAFNEIGKWYS